MTLLHRLLAPALTWPVDSQHHARRNALAASTALAQRRQERREVEQFLALHNRRFRSRERVQGPLPAPLDSRVEHRDVI